MSKSRPKLAALQLQEEPKPAFHVSNTGTFREGDLAINSKGLLINGSSPSTRTSNRPAPVDSSSSSSSSTASDGSFQLRDLKAMQELGKGAGGVVSKALHVPSNRIVALKVIPMDVSELTRKQIVLELKTLSQTQSPDIVSFYDAFFSEGSIYIALEYMDAGSLTDIMKYTGGKLSERILAHITFSVLKGLHYLHKELHLIHRDIKPSNLLLNTKGEAKIADFGVSGQLAHTMAKAVSWVGTVTYMSPERITGSSYSNDSDIWSLGLTLIECAIGRFPYIGAGGSSLGFWELLDFIVKSPAPTLSASDGFSPEFRGFVAVCLQKDPAQRPSATSLLSHPFIKKYENDKSFNMAAWVQSVIPRS